MTSVDGVEPAGDAKAWRRQVQRVAWIVVMAVVVVLVSGVVGWQVTARTAQVELGSASNSGAGATLPDCVPSNDLWAMFGTGEDVVLVQTVRNPSRWPIMVISREPEVFRFEPMADNPADDFLFGANPIDGAPDRTETSDRVVIPPDREATMWIVNPQGDVPTAEGWSTFGGAPVTLRALGVERDFYLPFWGTLAVGGAEATTDRLDRALQEACDA